jgi:small subunit ribosomal protein S20
MANTKQAKKRVRQNEVHRQNNASARSMVRTYIKKVVNLTQEGNHAEAEAAYKVVVPIIDRMANKGILHRNKAARHKSRLLAGIRKLTAVAA